MSLPGKRRAAGERAIGDDRRARTRRRAGRPRRRAPARAPCSRACRRSWPRVSVPRRGELDDAEVEHLPPASGPRSCSTQKMFCGLRSRWTISGRRGLGDRVGDVVDELEQTRLRAGAVRGADARRDRGRRGAPSRYRAARRRRAAVEVAEVEHAHDVRASSDDDDVAPRAESGGAGRSRRRDRGRTLTAAAEPSSAWRGAIDLAHRAAADHLTEENGPSRRSV